MSSAQSSTQQRTAKASGAHASGNPDAPKTADAPKNTDAPVIIAAADGSALGNPGPAGWAWYIDENQWAAGGWPKGTNNQGELQAVLKLLQATEAAGAPLKVLCDSQYVINSLTKWRFGWKKRGWKKADGKPVQNAELMKALDAALAGRKVEFEWVRGHTGNELNEAADDRARACAQAYKDGETPDEGPGYSGTPSQSNDEQNNDAGQGNAATQPSTVTQPSAMPATVDAGQASTDIRELLAAAEADLLDSIDQDDEPTLRYLLTEDFRGVSAHGALHGIDGLRGQDPITNLEVITTERVSQDIAYVAYRAQRASTADAVVLSWWRLTGDGRQAGTQRWQCFFRQETAHINV